MEHCLHSPRYPKNATISKHGPQHALKNKIHTSSRRNPTRWTRRMVTCSARFIRIDPRHRQVLCSTKAFFASGRVFQASSASILKAWRQQDDGCSVHDLLNRCAANDVLSPQPVQNPALGTPYDMIIGATDPVRQSTKRRDHATLDTCYKWCHSSIIRSRLKNAVAHGSLDATVTMCKSTSQDQAFCRQ